MSLIIDRRKTNKNKSVGNRKKFIERNKERIKRYIDHSTSDKGITDAVSEREVVLESVDEPSFNYDMTTGERDIVLPGNKNLKKGDRIYQPPKSDGSGSSGSDTGDGLDEFAFTLTKEEFLDLYFSDLHLPNFIKESLAGTAKWKWKRTGYSKQGIPPRLDLVKTLKQALARRIATKQECDETGISKKQRFLDDIDLRYKHFTKKPFPVKQAVMICLMDVSYSMGEFEKTLAKKFFLLLYLFLNKCYTEINVIFISHTQDAEEVTEQEFFHGQRTGGTIVSSGLQLAQNIIDTRIDLTSTNVYLAQASDGDNWSGDDEVASSLVESLLTSVQYFAYIQTESADRKEMKQDDDLMTIYSEISERNPRLQARHVTDCDEVYPVLRSLFEGDK